MKAKITLDTNYDLAYNEHGSVQVTLDNGQTLTASWTVKDGMASGFHATNHNIPGITDEQAEAILDAACEAVWGTDNIRTRQEDDGTVVVKWADLVEAANAGQ